MLMNKRKGLWRCQLVTHGHQLLECASKSVFFILRTHCKCYMAPHMMSHHVHPIKHTPEEQACDKNDGFQMMCDAFRTVMVR